MYWLGRCSSQAAQPCYLRRPDIMTGTAMETAIEPFNINKTETETGTGTETEIATTMIVTETEIETGTGAGTTVTVTMIATAETATAILMGAAVPTTMDAVATEAPANTAIKMA